MANKSIKKAGSLVLAASICASMFSVGTISNLKASAESTAESNARVFTADFSGIKDGVIDTNDRDAVSAIEDKFYVYNAQRNDPDGYTSYFERGKVNGYLVDDQVQPKPRYPDTAAFPAWNLDGWDKHADKTNAEKPIPMWRVDGKWLTCDAYSKSDAFMIREANMLYVKGNTPSGFASFENFTAQMSIKFKPLSEDVAEGTDALLFVFRARSAGQITDANQSAVAISPSGDIYAGVPWWTSTPQYNAVLADASGNKVALQRDKEYKLSLTVRGKTLTISVYDGSTLVGSYKKTDVVTGQGLLGFGGSNAGAYIADVQIAREDENGKTIDINDNGNGFGYGLDPQTLATFRYAYYVDTNGSGAIDNIWTNYYYRTDVDTFWLNFYNQRFGGEVWFGNGFTKETAYLNSVMGLYYEQVGNAGRAFQKVSFVDRNYAEINMGEGTGGQTMYMDSGNRLRATQDRGGVLLQQSSSYVPLTGDGKEAQAANAEMQFNTLLVTSNSQRASSITFRSKQAGAMLADAENGYADKITVVFNGKGIGVFDGEAMPLDGNGINYIPYNNNVTLEGAFVNAWAKVVGDKLYIRVWDDNNVYYDNAQSPITVKTEGEGYMYYSGLGGWAYFTDFKAAQLDENGDRLPWNFKVGGTSLSELNSAGKIKAVGRAAFVGDDFQMDWTNSGFEITGEISGDVSITAKRTDNANMDGIDGTYVNVVVDGGEATRVKIPNGTNTVKIASDLSVGKHTVQVTSAISAAFGTLSVSYIEFAGTLDVPKSNNSELRILAIGDSITAGFGVYGESGGKYTGFAEQIEMSDGNYSYAAVAARELNARLSVVANEAATINEVHTYYVNKLNRRDGAPDWNWSNENNDVVVINLGTNDEAQNNGNALADAKALLDDMRSKNPNAEIIWVYGMMRKSFEDVYKAAVQYMNDKGDDKVHILEMTPNTDGLGGHPSKAAQEEYGKELAAYIRGIVGDTYAAHNDTLKSLNDAGKLLVNGRSKWSDTDALVSTNGASGFTIKGQICDDVTLNLYQNENIIRFVIIVDGDRDNMKTLEIGTGDRTITLAENLERGTHTIEVYRATSNLGLTEFKSVAYNGTLEDAKPKNIQMEFLGDSITVGDGMLWDPLKQHEYMLDQNTMLGYASQTAAKLGADFSMIAHSGATTPGIVQIYGENNREFTINSTGKDIVVINLGTNDFGANITDSLVETFRNAAGELMNAVVEQNGKDVKIVWAYGMMTVNAMDVIREAVMSQAEGKNVWFCDLSEALDTAGYGVHPSQVGNDKAAEILAQFITDNCLQDLKEGDVNGDGTVDIRDLVRYKKYLSGIEVEFNLEKADLNGDGKYDALDLAALRQKLFEV